MKNTFTLLLSTALLISACGSGGKNTGESAKTTVLTEKDSIAVNQILVPRGIMVKGDILLLVADHHNGADTLFYAYGLPDGKFLFGQGVTGQGPDDFNMPILFSNAQSDTSFCAYNVGQDRINSYALDSNGFSLLTSVKSRKVLPRTAVNDSIVFGDISNWRAKTIGIYTENIKSGGKTDSIPTFSAIRQLQYGQSFNAVTNSFYLFGCGNKAAVAYQLMDRIEFYDISPDGKMTLVKAVGTDKLDPKYGNPNDTDDKLAFNSVEKYFEGGYATRDHLYVVNYCGTSSKDIYPENKNAPKTTPIDVYTWDGQLVKRLVLPGYYSFAVDEKRHTIYAIESWSDEDFTKIYSFRYKL